MPDNRELALLITVATFLLLALPCGPTRKSVLKVLACLFWSRLTIAGIVGLVWVGAAISVMWWFDMWSLSNMKDTLLWFATGGCLLIFHGMQVSNPNSEFRSLVAEQFKFALFFELVVNAYPLSLMAEFGLLFGTGLLAMLIATTDLNPVHAQVGRIFKFALGLVVIFVVGTAFYHLFTEPEEVFSRPGLQVFCLPIYFTLVLLPYGYLLTVYAAYETLFVTRLAQHAMMPPEVRRYAKWQLVKICKLNANAVRRAKEFLSVELRWADSREVVDAELLRLREELHWNKPPAAE
ncbi:MAG: hypothetical protein PSV22_04215 [Pseudolabrys sp.]|nr:hypothetical protein [Pseudolabrys sp.]